MIPVNYPRYTFAALQLSETEHSFSDHSLIFLQTDILLGFSVTPSNKITNYHLHTISVYRLIMKCGVNSPPACPHVITTTIASKRGSEWRNPCKSFTGAELTDYSVRVCVYLGLHAFLPLHLYDLRQKLEDFLSVSVSQVISPASASCPWRTV